jgi:hypothetical protein
MDGRPPWLALPKRPSNALLSVADETSRDVQVLKNAALQVIALNYKSLQIIRTQKISN